MASRGARRSARPAATRRFLAAATIGTVHAARAAQEIWRCCDPNCGKAFSLLPQDAASGRPADALCRSSLYHHYSTIDKATRPGSSATKFATDAEKRTSHRTALNGADRITAVAQAGREVCRLAPTGSKGAAVAILLAATPSGNVSGATAAAAAAAAASAGTAAPARTPIWRDPEFGATPPSAPAAPPMAPATPTAADATPAANYDISKFFDFDLDRLKRAHL